MGSDRPPVWILMASNRNHGEERITAMKTATLCTCVMAASTAFALDFNAPVEKLAGDFKFTEGPIWVAVKNEFLFSDIPRTASSASQMASGDLSSASGNANGLDARQTRPPIVCEHGPRRVTLTEADGTITVLADPTKANASTARMTWSSRAHPPFISPILRSA